MSDDCKWCDSWASEVKELERKRALQTERVVDLEQKLAQTHRLLDSSAKEYNALLASQSRQDQQDSRGSGSSVGAVEQHPNPCPEPCCKVIGPGDSKYTKGVSVAQQVADKYDEDRKKATETTRSADEAAKDYCENITRYTADAVYYAFRSGWDAALKAQPDYQTLRDALQYYATGDGSHGFYGTHHDDVSRVGDDENYSWVSGRRAREALTTRQVTVAKVSPEAAAETLARRQAYDLAEAQQDYPRRHPKHTKERCWHGLAWNVICPGCQSGT